MPEMLEAELYRQLAARAVGRKVGAVDAPDELILRGGLTAAEVTAALTGVTVLGARRIGKVVFLDTNGSTVALRFGMTGVLEVDGAFGVGDLQYASNRQDPRWIRFALHLEDGGAVALHDARRLGGVELDLDESRLGIDATELDAASLRTAVSGSTTAVKARLMDQRRIAGLGNLLADEILWRASIDPARRCVDLGARRIRRLAEEVRSTVADLGARGGSHLGDLPRERGATCPRDGAVLARRVVGGRTTYSCPRHQR